MNALRTIIRRKSIAALAAAAMAAQMPLMTSPAQAADCYSIGQQVAAQEGGTLAKAAASSQGG